MEIKKIYENQFEVVLSLDDLKKFNTNLIEVMSKGIKNLIFFPNIVKYIDKLSNYSLQKRKFIFETFFINNSYFLIEFRSIGILSKEGYFVCKIGKEINILEKSPLIFKFSSFDSLCNFLKSSLYKPKCIEFYEYKNSYFAIINYSELFDSSCLQISEFAKYLSCSDIFVGKISEFGHNIKQ